MPQSPEQLKTAYDRIIGLANRRLWVPAAPAPLELRVVAVDGADRVGFSEVASLVAYARSALDVDLRLDAGGHGCIEFGFTAASSDSARVERAVEQDAGLQERLNELGAHAVHVTAGRIRRSFCAQHDLQIPIITNRAPAAAVMSEDAGVVGMFDNELGAGTHYALADMSVIDLSTGQSRDSLLRRVWRKATFSIFERRRTPRRAIARQIAEQDRTAFDRTLRELAVDGALVTVHGYANDFDDALRSCTLGDYLMKLSQLGRAAVLFSWPSQGSPLAYTPDENRARNSQRPFVDALQSVVDTLRGRRVDVLAHSHGNMVVVSALGEKTCRLSQSPLGSFVLVEPDVDQRYLEQRVDDVLAACGRVVLYHSRSDRALWFAEKLFASVRAGRAGASAATVDGRDDRLEVVDASRVAAGLARHAPHLDSPEVIRDIRDVLEGKAATGRIGVRETSRPGFWEIES